MDQVNTPNNSIPAVNNEVNTSNAGSAVNSKPTSPYNFDTNVKSPLTSASNNKQTIIISSIAIVLVLAAIGGIYWYMNSVNSSPNTVSTKTTTMPVVSNTPTVSPTPSVTVQMPTSLQSAQNQLNNLQAVMDQTSQNESSDYTSYNSDLNNSSSALSEEQSSQQL